MSENVVQYLKNRGLVADQTHDNLDEILSKKRVAVYAGFDPTNDSLTVGNLTIIMLLRRFQRFGHKPIAVVGGGTALVGDPSGKDAERTLQTVDDVRARAEKIREELSRFLTFGDGPSDAVLVNNYDWLSELDLIAFLRDVGKYFRVQDMIARESVKRRLGSQSGISFTEFSYQLMQAYDFLHLFKTHNCEMQVGGSDQWGNITAGTDLIGRVMGKQAYGLTGPLLTDSRGRKIGKTEDGTGTVWLNPEMTKPFDFYQYWVRTDDQTVMSLFRTFTDVTNDELRDIEAQITSSPNAAQKRLAFEITALVHGREQAEQAAAAARDVFAGGKSEDAPTTALTAAQLDGMSVADAFMLAGLVPSKGEARRRAKAGGIYVNDERVDNADAVLAPSVFDADGRCLLRFGKKISISSRSSAKRSNP
ncbi:MAG: tyrosine--tRNA ligase [Deltaproteobacteria bacterium]|nr:tyrosine--tRNA ligase [Deltaproteobacteria bacterium]